MKFGSFPIRDAHGAILAHAVRTADRRFAKGLRLSAADLEALRRAGVESVVAAVMEPGDVAEDEAAGRIADALASAGIEAAGAATGRSNLYARSGGVFVPDRALVDALNRLDPGITLATLPSFAPVDGGRMVATVKIIPLAVPGASVDAAVALLRGAKALVLAPFRARGVRLIQTTLPTFKPSVLDKTRETLAARLRASGSEIRRETRCLHDVEALGTALLDGLPDEELTIVFGASAVIDTDDVVPAAVRRAGGRVDHLGMPVDPGNLLMLGRVGSQIVIGAPGCARSIKENGFDWVLNRILADLPVTPQNLTGFGVGGLLMEIASRPQPRDQAPKETADRSRVGIAVLAAGRSSRMNGPNKLLATFGGVPLIRRSVETALASSAVSVHVVVGHMEEEIAAALAGLPVTLVRNERFADGLSTSLIAGFEAAAANVDAVLVMLADQPLLTAPDLDRLIGAFRPSGEGSIVLACDEGRRANPVVLSTGFAPEILQLSGDVGARSIVQANLEVVREIELGSAASFDVDTPELMARAGGVMPELAHAVHQDGALSD